MLETKNIELKIVQIDMSVATRIAPPRSQGKLNQLKTWLNVVLQPTRKRWKDVLVYSCDAFRYFYSGINFKLKLSIVAKKGKKINERCLQKVTPAWGV